MTFIYQAQIWTSSYLRMTQQFSELWTIFTQSGDISLISNEINKEMKKIEIWVSANKLKINASKTKSMCFHTKQK